jgi:hypothetical protein
MKDNNGGSDIASAILTLLTGFNPLNPDSFFMYRQV